MTPFSTNEDELLVSLISQNPPIYDAKSEKDTTVRDSIWEEIARQLNKSSQDCKKRWKHIKDSYNRCIRKVKATSKPRIKWTLFNSLSFLNNFPVETRPVKIEAKEENDEWTENYYDDGFLHTEAEVSGEDTNEGMMTTGEEIITDNISEMTIELGAEMINPEIVTVTATSGREENGDRRISKARVKRRIIKRKPGMRKMNKSLVKYWEEKERQLQAKIKSLSENQEALGIRSFCDHVGSILTKLPPLLRVEAKNKMFNILSQYEMASVSSSYHNSLDPLQD